MRRQPVQQPGTLHRIVSLESVRFTEDAAICTVRAQFWKEGGGVLETTRSIVTSIERGQQALNWGGMRK